MIFDKGQVVLSGYGTFGLVTETQVQKPTFIIMHFGMSEKRLGQYTFKQRACTKALTRVNEAKDVFRNHSEQKAMVSAYSDGKRA